MTLNKVLELIGSILAVLGVFLIANDYPSGWCYSLVANIAMLIMSYRVGMGYLLLMNVFFFVANGIGAYKYLITLFQ